MMNGGRMGSDRFRLQYLSAINIRKSNKKKFNLSEFVIQIDKFLGIPQAETDKELNDLQDETDLINPITGKLNNPSHESKEDEAKKEGKDENDNGKQQKEENKE